VLDLVRLVKDHRRVFGQHRSVFSVAQREIGEKQMMIDDHNVGFESLATHPSYEARVEVGTSLSKTGLGPRIDLRPEAERLGTIGQLGAVSGLAFGGPLPDSFEVVYLFKPLEDRSLGRFF